MPSPFPGMDPYLEGEMWQEFHETLAGEIRAQLLPKLAPKYVALLAKRYVIQHVSAPLMGVATQRAIYPDVHVAQPPRVSEPAVAYDALAPTAELISPIEEQVPVTSVEVRDVANRTLVTVIEILSPANKQDPGAAEYHQRRMELLKTRTHLLEIDLLRGGRRITLVGELPAAPYFVFLSRWQRRPVTEVYAIQLRERLPRVPVPLLPPDPDVVLDLQAAVDACFRLVGYERLLSYDQPPPPPELSLDDLAWVKERLRHATAQPVA
ncbi:MAG: DUF4058 family protein [Anaerolineae bacterium]|nr:DUF4058 family protein [Candidatus Roseilinea sp.]MDW8448948.1 DUF4058 family protein [Anaerolineae bacterium]